MKQQVFWWCCYGNYMQVIVVRIDVSISDVLLLFEILQVYYMYVYLF